MSQIHNKIPNNMSIVRTHYRSYFIYILTPNKGRCMGCNI